MQRNKTLNTAKTVSRHFLFILVAALWSTPGVIVADEILFKNGDQITGKLIKKENKHLFFHTDYAGKITVKWNDILRLSTDSEVTVLTTDDELIKGTLELDSSTRTIINPINGGTARTVAISKIDYINPPPYLAGEGLDQSGNAFLGLNLERGNTNLDSVNFDGEWIWRTRRTRYTAAVTVRRAENDGVTEKSNSSATLKYDNFIDQKRYAYGSATQAKDRFKDIDVQTLWGVGMGYQQVETTAKNVYLEGGLSYIDENSIADNDKEFFALRWSFKFEQQLFGSSARFFHTHEALAGIDVPEEKALNSSTGIRFPVTGQLDASIEYEMDWTNNPLSDTKKLNSTTLINFGYQW